jgi:hypothetical protein
MKSDTRDSFVTRVKNQWPRLLLAPAVSSVVASVIMIAVTSLRFVMPEWYSWLQFGALIGGVLSGYLVIPANIRRSVVVSVIYITAMGFVLVWLMLMIAIGVFHMN